MMVPQFAIIAMVESLQPYEYCIDMAMGPYVFHTRHCLTDANGVAHNSYGLVS
jgi:hypothetical protein